MDHAARSGMLHRSWLRAYLQRSRFARRSGALLRRSQNSVIYGRKNVVSATPRTGNQSRYLTHESLGMEVP